jgi:hypothetical protein
MRETKYPQGYLPKIQYWATRLAEASYQGESEKLPYIWSKLQYFMERQKQLELVEMPGFEGTSSALSNLSILK